MIDSDTESENEIHVLEKTSQVCQLYIECNNLHSASEITEFLAGQNKNRQSQALVSAKIPWSKIKLIGTGENREVRFISKDNYSNNNSNSIIHNLLVKLLGAI